MPRAQKTGAKAASTRLQARLAWSQILAALTDSSGEADRRLATEVAAMLNGSDRRQRATVANIGKTVPRAAQDSGRSPSR